MMVRRMLVLLILILGFVPLTLAYDLSDFPKFIEKSAVDSIVVIGDSANSYDLQAGVSIIGSYDDCAYTHFSNNTNLPNLISDNIGINPPGFSRCRSAATTLASSIADLSAQNIISVGGPCANKITAQIMDLPTTWPGCAYGFKEGEGRIVLYNKFNRTQLIVSGYAENDTKNAAKILVNYKDYNLIDNDIIVNKSLQITKNEKYYDWNVWFVIYKSAGRVVEFVSDDEFELTKQAILSIIQPTEYDVSSFNISYHGIDNWYTGGEKTGKKNGFRIDVTQKGYKNVIIKIKDIENLKSIYFNIIIDQEIQKIPENEEEIINCKFDRECIKISGDCCGCNAGGTSTTINRAYYNYWNNKFGENCQGISCIGVMSEHWTCFAEPKCVSNKCNLISKELLTKEKCENPTDWIVYLKEETGDYYKIYLKIIEPGDVNLTKETHFIGKLNKGCESTGYERCLLYRLNDTFLYVLDGSLREYIGRTIEVVGKKVIIEGNKEIEIWPNKIRICSN